MRRSSFPSLFSKVQYIGAEAHLCGCVIVCAYFVLLLPFLILHTVRYVLCVLLETSKRSKGNQFNSPEEDFFPEKNWLPQVGFKSLLSRLSALPL